MSWTYSISTGMLADPFGAQYGPGYSGNGAWKNQAGDIEVRNHGPIPIGGYTMGKSIDSATLGPLAIPLTPKATNQMFDRGGFWMHGDSLSHPGDASDGCIVQDHDTRMAADASADRDLEVVA